MQKRLAYYWSELNVLHPFREGNGRTTREFIRQIALKYNYNLNLQNFTAQEILDASIKSIVDTKDLEDIVNKCLEHNKFFPPALVGILLLTYLFVLLLLFLVLEYVVLHLLLEQ